MIPTPTKQSPYEVPSEGGSRAFLAVTIDSAATYLPWHALKRMKLDEGRGLLNLEFIHESVEMSGSGLGVIAELAALTRLKLIRQGESDAVRISSIRLITDND